MNNKLDNLINNKDTKIIVETMTMVKVNYQVIYKCGLKKMCF